jgi:hypothetical protein
LKLLELLLARFELLGGDLGCSCVLASSCWALASSCCALSLSNFTASAQYNSATATTASTTADPDPRIPAPFALGSSGRARLPATIRPSG